MEVLADNDLADIPDGGLVDILEVDILVARRLVVDLDLEGSFADFRDAIESESPMPNRHSNYYRDFALSCSDRMTF